MYLLIPDETPDDTSIPAPATRQAATSSMLSRRERYTVQQRKIWGFTAYLDRAYQDYDAIQCGKIPTKEGIQKLCGDMKMMKTAFDAKYSENEEGELSMLQQEKTAWKLLSQRIGSFMARLEEDISNGNISDRKSLLPHMSEFMEILHGWNIISMAFRQKLERGLSNHERTQRELQGMIERFRSAVQMASAVPNPQE